MKTCRKCSKPNEDHYKLCLGCGAPLASAETPKVEGTEPTTKKKSWFKKLLGR